MFKEPCVLYKPEGVYCKVKDQDEYDRATKDGFTEALPKDWGHEADPAVPGGSKKQTEVGVPGSPKQPTAPAKPAAATPEANAKILEGSVGDVVDAVHRVTDADQLRALRTMEAHGKNRAGALDAIDARIVELKK